MIAAHHEVATEEVDVAANDQQAHPYRKLSACNKAKHAGEKQRSVNNGIHELTQPAYRFGHAGNLAVKPIGGGSNGIDNECNVAVEIRYEEIEENKGKDESRDGNEV